eukprot:221173-Pelagomonas_calceolata.AAC.2
MDFLSSGRLLTEPELPHHYPLPSSSLPAGPKALGAATYGAGQLQLRVVFVTAQPDCCMDTSQCMMENASSRSDAAVIVRAGRAGGNRARRTSLEGQDADQTCVQVLSSCNPEVSPPAGTRGCPQGPLESAILRAP